MLLRDEAQLSASSKISSVLAHSQSTFYCSEEQFSYPRDNTGWGFCPQKLIIFTNADLPCIHMWGLWKLHQAWLLCNQEHPVGLQVTRGESTAPPTSWDDGDVLYLPKFYSGVRCVHYSTHREWQIEGSRSSSSSGGSSSSGSGGSSGSRREPPWEKAGLNSVRLFPFSPESRRRCVVCFTGLLGLCT